MSSPTAAEMVAEIDNAILALIQGGATAEYQISSERWRGYSLVELRSLRDQYQADADRQNGSSFHLARKVSW